MGAVGRAIPVSEESTVSAVEPPFRPSSVPSVGVGGAVHAISPSIHHPRPIEPPVVHPTFANGGPRDGVTHGGPA